MENSTCNTCNNSFEHGVYGGSYTNLGNTIEECCLLCHQAVCEECAQSWWNSDTLYKLCIPCEEELSLALSAIDPDLSSRRFANMNSSHLRYREVDSSHSTCFHCHFRASGLAKVAQVRTCRECSQETCFQCERESVAQEYSGFLYLESSFTCKACNLERIRLQEEVYTQERKCPDCKSLILVPTAHCQDVNDLIAVSMRRGIEVYSQCEVCKSLHCESCTQLKTINKRRKRVCKECAESGSWLKTTIRRLLP